MATKTLERTRKEVKPNALTQAWMAGFSDGVRVMREQIEIMWPDMADFAPSVATRALSTIGGEEKKAARNRYRFKLPKNGK
jgi:hypothetical protein